MTPLYDRIIVKRIEDTEQTRGGIVIPDVAKRRPQEGTVIAVGEGRILPQSGRVVPLAVKVGDRVLFGRYAGTEVTIDEETVVVLLEADVMAVL